MIELGFDFAVDMTKMNFSEGFSVNSFNTFCDVRVFLWVGVFAVIFIPWFFEHMFYREDQPL